MSAPGYTTFLYRFYNGRGRLLYVGITANIDRRVRSHATALWYWDATHLEVICFYNKRAASAAECEAIRTEWPLWNVKGALDPTAARLIGEEQQRIQARAPQAPREISDRELRDSCRRWAAQHCHLLRTMTLIDGAELGLDSEPEAGPPQGPH